MALLKKWRAAFSRQNALTKKLLCCIILSAAFNIIFGAMVISSSIDNGTLYETVSLSNIRHALFADEKNNVEVLEAFKVLPYEQLIKKLRDDTLVDYGYTKRDLALGCLVKYHDIDIERALGGNPKQHRTVTLLNEEGIKEAVVLFPGLRDMHFRKTLGFLRAERWPQTTKGLFFAMKKASTGMTSENMEAFSRREEFMAIEKMFSKAEVRVSKERVLNIIATGTWEMIKDFGEEQRNTPDLSDNRRRLFLLDYIECESVDAAEVLLATDAEFVVEKIDDEHAMMMLDILKNKDGLAWALVNALNDSPRSDGVKNKAQRRLRIWNGEDIADVDDVTEENAIEEAIEEKTEDAIEEATAEEDAAKEIVKEVAIAEEILVEEKYDVVIEEEQQGQEYEETFYTVESGDSLWKIARKFETDVTTIKKLNGLDDDVIMPGMKLITGK